MSNPKTVFVVLAVINTAMSVLLALRAIAKGISISSVLPNSALAILFWLMAAIS